jgi:uncharacterized membrane protein YgaE (UPF0421/DUF939 family)
VQPRHLEAVVFSVKAAVSALTGALGYKLFGLPGAPWVAAVSAVIVTQPSLHSSFRASLWRVTANLAGAFGGAALGLVIGQPLAAMSVGVMLTGLVCYLLKQEDMLRPAFVAVVIVTLSGESAQWRVSVNRVEAVIVGCLCAMIVGLLFDKLAGGIRLPNNAGEKNDGPAE